MINKILRTISQIPKRKILKRNILKKKDTKIEDKPDNIEKHNNATKKDTKKKDTKKEDKPDNIKKYNDKPPKTFNTIEKIVNRLICEKFMNEKYYEKVDEDNIVFYLINKPVKGVKMKHMIEISREMITLAIAKETRAKNEVITICIIIKLNIAQRENQNKQDMFIKISDDEIVCSISSITDEYQKYISEVINCSNNIRCNVLKNIMYCIIKICDKKNDENNKKKKK